MVVRPFGAAQTERPETGGVSGARHVDIPGRAD